MVSQEGFLEESRESLASGDEPHPPEGLGGRSEPSAQVRAESSLQPLLLLLSSKQLVAQMPSAPHGPAVTAPPPSEPLLGGGDILWPFGSPVA